MSYDSYQIDHDQDQINHNSIKSNYNLNEYDHKSNDFDYKINHNFIDLINLDLIDVDFIDLDWFDQVDQNHEIDQINYIVEIDFQPILIDLHREINLSFKIVQKEKNHVFLSYC